MTLLRFEKDLMALEFLSCKVGLRFENCYRCFGTEERRLLLLPIVE